MEIRKMNIYDYSQVYELWVSCSGVGLNILDDSKESIERFLKRNPDTCFVAEEDMKIIGVIMAGNDGRRGHIYHVAVDSQFRNRRIGTVLVENVLLALKELGINKVALVVFKTNNGGNDFWEKLGFTVRNDLVYRNKSIVEIITNNT